MGAARKQKTVDLLSQKELLAIVVKSLADTIAGYTKTRVSSGAPSVKPVADKADIAVGGLIRFEAGDFALELFLGFTKDLFEMLYESMFQVPPDDITPENHDLAGELLNIAFGQMDPEFRKHGYRMSSSLPFIFSGAKLADVLGKLDADAIVIPYTANEKKFVVNLYSAGSLPMEWKFPGSGKK